MRDDEPPIEDDEPRSMRRLDAVRDPVTGELPQDGAEVLAFRNSAGEPVVVPTAVATEAERAYRCYQKRLEGIPWEVIAREEQYPSAAACKADVDRYLAEARSLVVESSAKEMLRTEMARMDMLQTFIWGAAEDGSIPAVSEIRQLIMGRAKLAVYLGQGMTEESDTTQTVVVPRDSGHYLATLQGAAGTVPAEPE